MNPSIPHQTMRTKRTGQSQRRNREMREHGAQATVGTPETQPGCAQAHVACLEDARSQTQTRGTHESDAEQRGPGASGFVGVSAHRRAACTVP